MIHWELYQFVLCYFPYGLYCEFKPTGRNGNPDIIRNNYPPKSFQLPDIWCSLIYIIWWKVAEPEPDYPHILYNIIVRDPLEICPTGTGESSKGTSRSTLIRTLIWNIKCLFQKHKFWFKKLVLQSFETWAIGSKPETKMLITFLSMAVLKRFL